MEMRRISSFLIVLTSLCAHILTQQSQLPTKLLEDLVNNHNKIFNNFKITFKKRYSNPSEQLYRNLVHYRNQKAVRAHNINPQAKYTMQINEFADLDPEQFRLTYAKLIMPDESIKNFAKTVQEKVELQKEDCSCKMENQLKQLQLKAKIKSQNSIINKKKYEFFAAQSVAFQKQEKKVLNFPKELLSLSQDQYEVIQQKLDPSRPDYMKKSTFPEKSSFVPSALTQLFNFHSSPPNINPELELHVDSNPRLLLEEDLSEYNSDWTEFAGQARSQGLCGACYAFAAVQNLESILAIYAFNSVMELSVQQIIDCAGYTNLTLGCDGGYLEGPFVYLKNYGITTSFSYPYNSGMTGEIGKCQTTEGFFKISSYKALPSGNCTALREVLLKKPVSVAIASYRLQFYKSGVFTDCNSYIDHAVIVIGYEYGKGWKIKNSWGKNWGENGFAWLADGNSCSLCDYAMVPKITQQPAENP